MGEERSTMLRMVFLFKSRVFTFVHHSTIQSEEQSEWEVFDGSRHRLRRQTQRGRRFGQSKMVSNHIETIILHSPHSQSCDHEIKACVKYFIAKSFPMSPLTFKSDRKGLDSRLQSPFTRQVILRGK